MEQWSPTFENLKPDGPRWSWGGAADADGALLGHSSPLAVRPSS